MRVSTLFDDVVRSDTGPAAYAEPSFPYWNRTARADIERVRYELEQWFARYPPSSAPDLRARVRSSNDVQHQGAFFELFLHELLLRKDASVDPHPAVLGTTKRPEFDVTPVDGASFYLEAKVATDESSTEASARQRANMVYDAINDLASPDFWINVEVEGAPNSLVPTRKLKTFVEKCLSGADYDDVATKYERSGLAELPRWRYEHDGWIVDFFPIPKQKARGRGGTRPMGLQMPGPKWVDPVSPLRDAILQKAKRYGTPDKPYVIAINALSEWLESDQIVEALFGDEEWVSRFPEDELRFRRKRNGVWTSSSGTYTRVSAVMVFQKLHPWSFPAAAVRLYHHPQAQRPLNDGPLMALPQARVTGDELILTDGESIGDVFGLSADWLAELR